MSSHHPENNNTADTETALSPPMGPVQAASSLLSQLAGSDGALTEAWALKQLLAQLEALLQAQLFQHEQYRRYRDEAQAEQAQGQTALHGQLRALQRVIEQQRDRIAELEDALATAQTNHIPLQVQHAEALKQSDRLLGQLQQRRSQVEQLAEQLEQAETTLREQQQLSSDQARQLLGLSQELERSRREAAALETRLDHQDALKTQLRDETQQERQALYKKRDRLLQLEQDLTQLKAELLRQGEQHQSSLQESQQWRRLAQLQARQLRDILQWAATAQDIPSELMACLTPVMEMGASLEPPMGEMGAPILASMPETTAPAPQTASPSAVQDRPTEPPGQSAKTNPPSQLDLPRFPSGAEG